MLTIKKEIADEYIRNLLKKQFKKYEMTDEEITQELIDMKREQLLAGRVLRAYNVYVKKIRGKRGRR
jgi:hypothetical protein